MRKSRVPMKLVSFLELTDDVDELMELLSQAESIRGQAEHEYRLRQAERTVIKEKLKKIRSKDSDIHVSDHAVVRYLDRVVGMDIDACKEEIRSKLPKDYVQSDLVEVYSTEIGGIDYVIRDNLIISVVPLRDERTKLRGDK